MWRKHLWLVSLLIVGLINNLMPVNVRAESCPDLRVVFARGSGGIRWTDDNYQAFKAAIESKLLLTELSYVFIDLDYPAVRIGLDELDVSLGALVSGGDTYQFGESVDTGVKNLIELVNNNGCMDTKYVISGYSQGAMVISKSLGSLKAERIIYAATFGDPKIYLPEGKGLFPAACRGNNLSDYRMYVPDCRAYQGLLGSYIPYEPISFEGKLGTWCNKGDIFCSSHFNASDHQRYIADNLYEDASKVIFDKITSAFKIENNFTSLHDTAILIDSTGSMASMIEKYKAEALRLAEETFTSGGRVALYDYRDLKDPYEPIEHCNFNNCTLEIFEQELKTISTGNGGDEPESLLSSALHVMKSLEWNYGSTKSVVVLTDADFLSPDRDGTTLEEVVALSKTIDPVNFYIVTDSNQEDNYLELAARTDGRVVTNFNELNLLTDYIMDRYDSLPKVEESLDEEIFIPTLKVLETKQISNSEMLVDFQSDTLKTMIILNDSILGITDKTEIILTDLDNSRENILTLVPITETRRGEGESVKLIFSDTTIKDPILRAPNTGRM